jgi:hypothetical protein
MSSVSIQGNASGTGIFTIASPNSNTNRTLTLPDSTGTVLVSGGSQSIEFAAGTASAPSITTTGDTNTGIFFPSADTIGFTEGGTQVGEFDSSANFKFNSGYGSVAVAYGCRAWVNFNGTGTVAIRASANITSITDNGTGEYTANFTNAMPDANYAVAGCGVASNATGGSYGWLTSLRGRTSGSCQTGSVSVTNTNSAGSLTDADLITVSVFR